MSGWLIMVFPDGDPERVHIVPAIGEGDDAEVDPVHDPSPLCGCSPRIKVETDTPDFVPRELVVHNGPN